MIIDMKSRGFTIVELIIVIFIIGVLLVLGVANLRSAQASARDSERQGDVDSIALNLEMFYQSGTDSSSPTGDYPSTVLISSGLESMQTILRDIDIKALTAPGITDPLQTFIAATNNTQTTAGVTPQPTIDQYVYQPIQSNGSLCTQESQDCKKFNLYFRSESDNNVYMITSKNQ